MKSIIVAGASLLLLTAEGCSALRSDACYGISDAEAFETVHRVYPDGFKIQMAEGHVEDVKFGKDRLLRVGRLNDPRDRQNSETQLWFSEENNTDAVVNVYGDCEVKVSFARAEDINAAANPLEPPKL